MQAPSWDPVPRNSMALLLSSNLSRGTAGQLGQPGHKRISAGPLVTACHEVHVVKCCYSDIGNFSCEMFFFSPVRAGSAQWLGPLYRATELNQPNPEKKKNVLNVKMKK